MPVTKEQELIDLDIELKRTLLEDAKANLQNTREKVQREANDRGRKISIQRQRAAQLQEEENLRRARVIACPHKKGGMDLVGYREGTDEQYAVIRHQHMNGDYMMKCQRCPAIILPPVEPIKADLTEELEAQVSRYGFNFETAGFFAKEDIKRYAQAVKTFRQANQRYNFWLKMPTLNVTSTSGLVVQVQDTGVFNFKRLYRLAMHEIHHIPVFWEQQWPPEDEKLLAA